VRERGREHVRACVVGSVCDYACVAEGHDKVKAYVTGDARRPGFEPWSF
jgi:hypothetical protein